MKTGLNEAPRVGPRQGPRYITGTQGGLLSLMDSEDLMHIHCDHLIVGCGDIGLRVARRLLKEGQRVLGLVRSEARERALRAQGLEVLRLDLDQPVPESLTLTVRTLYGLMPPPSHGDRDTRTERLLACLGTPPERWVQISTSGVYGDCAGDWVNESRPPNPMSDRALRRLHSETLLDQYARAQGVCLTLLRVPGIYGPSRLPIERIQRQSPVVLPEQSPYSNRIHAEDLARAVLFAGASPAAEGLLNVSDGHPTTMTDYFWTVADFLGLPRPPALPLEAALEVLGPQMASFLRESRRLDSTRLTHELGFQLRYPTLAQGLAQCLEDHLPE